MKKTTEINLVGMWACHTIPCVLGGGFGLLALIEKTDRERCH